MIVEMLTHDIYRAARIDSNCEREAGAYIFHLDPLGDPGWEEIRARIIFFIKQNKEIRGMFFTSIMAEGGYLVKKKNHK